VLDIQYKQKCRIIQTVTMLHFTCIPIQ